jgi:hypothetical protein
MKEVLELTLEHKESYFKLVTSQNKLNKVRSNRLAALNMSDIEWMLTSGTTYGVVEDDRVTMAQPIRHCEFLGAHYLGSLLSNSERDVCDNFQYLTAYVVNKLGTRDVKEVFWSAPVNTFVRTGKLREQMRQPWYDADWKIETICTVPRDTIIGRYRRLIYNFCDYELIIQRAVKL